MAILGITDDGVINAARIAQLAAVAVAVANTVAAVQMAEKQEELAKDYLKIAQEQNKYYYDVYVPCEDEEIEEACSAQPYVEHVDIQVGRFKNVASHGFAHQVEDAVSCLSRYCTGKKAAVIKDIMLAEAGATATSANLGRRYEELYADARDDVRWARRSQALARGRDMMAQSVTFAGMAYGLFGRLGDQAAAGASGAIGYLGYTLNRNELVSQRTPRRLLGISYPVPSPQLQEQPMPQNMVQQPTRTRVMG